MWDGALNWGARGGNAGWIGVATGAPIVCAGDNVAGDLKDGSGSGLVVESDVPCTGLAGRRRLRQAGRVAAAWKCCQLQECPEWRRSVGMERRL